MKSARFDDGSVLVMRLTLRCPSIGVPTVVQLLTLSVSLYLNREVKYEDFLEQGKSN